MKIYTKTGDKGKTSLIEGTRISKHNIRVHCYGEIDELNAHLGMLCDVLENQEEIMLIKEIQHNLFLIGSHLATETYHHQLPSLDNQMIQSLESYIDKQDEVLPALKNFILPGGNTSISWCHIARTICRRAERSISQLYEAESIQDIILIYLNRLSDFLFVLARVLHYRKGIKESTWKKGR